MINQESQWMKFKTGNLKENPISVVYVHFIKVKNRLPLFRSLNDLLICSVSVFYFSSVKFNNVLRVSLK